MAKSNVVPKHPTFLNASLTSLQIYINYTLPTLFQTLPAMVLNIAIEIYSKNVCDNFKSLSCFFQTSLPEFRKPEFSVVRLHEEFVWLHDRFEENEVYAGYIVRRHYALKLYL